MADTCKVTPTNQANQAFFEGLTLKRTLDHMSVRTHVITFCVNNQARPATFHPGTEKDTAQNGGATNLPRIRDP